MQRHILAVSALVMLLVAAGAWWWNPASEGVLAFCWRMGAILAAAWLAYDDVQRLPTWLLLTLPIVLIVLVRWPRLLLILLPALIVLVVVRRLLWSGGPHRPT
jgi:hypothetical protein